MFYSPFFWLEKRDGQELKNINFFLYRNRSGGKKVEISTWKFQEISCHPDVVFVFFRHKK
jgi:hypothetical protein